MKRQAEREEVVILLREASVRARLGLLCPQEQEREGQIEDVGDLDAVGEVETSARRETSDPVVLGFVHGRQRPTEAQVLVPDTSSDVPPGLGLVEESNAEGCGRLCRKGDIAESDRSKADRKSTRRPPIGRRIWYFDIEQPKYNVPFGLGVGKVIPTERIIDKLCVEPQLAVALRGLSQPAVQICAGINM